MKTLDKVREGWSVIEAEETRLLRSKTIAESVAEFLALQSEFEAQLQQTEPYFREQRNRAMAELQARLLKLNDREGAGMKKLISAVVALQGRLEQAGLPSMVIGGLAVSVWGQPRLTRDVDVKVLARRDDRARVLGLLAGYTSLHADPDEAFRRQGMAFFQDRDGNRIDVLLAETSFDETAIGRAKMMALEPGLTARVCTAEDLIVYKMVSLRTQDRVDVEGIIRRQGNALDDGYIETWLRELERALDDSTLVAEYRRLRKRFSGPK